MGILRLEQNPQKKENCVKSPIRGNSRMVFMMAIKYGHKDEENWLIICLSLKRDSFCVSGAKR